MFYNKEIEYFISDFVSELGDNNVAIFAGAGLSAPSGFVDWKGLMKDFSDQIDLDVEKEDDLISLAQYYLNKQKGNRYSITKKLVEEFTQDKIPNDNHRILARLPIPVYWTTNYDRLIEKSLVDNNKKPDSKYAKEHFVKTIPKRDAIVYKMHGDIEHLHEVVLTKDQYESYYETHSAFLSTLAGDLTARTFLFIGYSFNDPNLQYILARVRVLYKDHQRRHYCFFRELKQWKNESYEDFEYRRVKQKLIIEDLARFNIHVLLVKEYEDITKILLEIERRYKMKTVFISGSAYTFDGFKNNGAELGRELSIALLKHGYKIVSGFGLGVGQYVIDGALDEIYNNRKERLSDQLQLFPFPVSSNSPDIQNNYRDNMISHAGITIFLFGNKLKDGSLINSPGLEKEFKISEQKKLLLVPVGATGYASRELWNEVINNYDKYYQEKNKFEMLKKLGDTSLTNSQLINIILEFIK
ncbi:SIR2 family protein [Pinibacter soli]|uniref:NAD(+) hydrolase ThsA n=1 Tax=Pinibacter soli TaxID=3044211 RepID=A0ABT6RHQ1_9BACT|nr:SIR2 family protein [Pinibacter soli]MDI3322006.1 SIR2 family protein [Pinibacter soli]